MSTNRSTRLVLGLLAAASAVAGTAGVSLAATKRPAAAFSDPSNGVQARSVSVGIISDETGPTTATQIPWRDGIDTYINMINHKGGVNGRKIVVNQCDEQYNVAAAMVCYKGMTSTNPVLAIMGGNDSSFQDAMMPSVRATSMPIVGAESTNQDAVNPFAKSFFALECTYPAQADVSVSFGMGLIHNYHPTAMAAVLGVASGYDYGNNQIQPRIVKAGGKYLGTVVLPYGATNLDAQAQQVAAAKPDLIFVHGSPESTTTFLQALVKFGVTNTPIIGIFATEDTDIPAAVPQIASHYYVVNCYNAANQPHVPGGHALIKAAQAAGYPASIYTNTNFTNGYVVGEVLVKGMQNAGKRLTRASLIKGLAKITNFVTGLSPNVSFGAHNRIGIQPVAPLAFSTKYRVFQQIGTYANYNKCVADNFYITQSLAKWSPHCVPASVYKSLP